MFYFIDVVRQQDDKENGGRLRFILAVGILSVASNVL